MKLMISESGVTTNPKLKHSMMTTMALCLFAIAIWNTNTVYVANIQNESTTKSTYINTETNKIVIPFYEQVEGFIGNENETFKIKPALAGLPC